MLTNQYPGVHVQEIPSGARPIASVSTSNTAFVDTFADGPLNEAVRITSWGDFEEIFGGLNPASEASYAIWQYFLNGGGVAFVVRVEGGLSEAMNTPGEIVFRSIDGTPALRVTALDASGPEIRVAIAKSDTNSHFSLLVQEIVDGAVTTTESYIKLDRRTTMQDRFGPEIKVNGISTLVEVEILNLGDVNAPMPVSTDLPSGTPGEGSTIAELEAAAFSELPVMGISPIVGEMEDVSLHTAIIGSQAERTGIFALENIVPEIFNMMCLPACAKMVQAEAKAVYEAAEAFCEDKFAFLFVDPSDTTHDKIYDDWFSQMGAAVSENAAGYYPMLSFDDPLDPGTTRKIGPSGMIAGMTARIDGTRGLWKSPAGTETRFAGGTPDYLLTDLEQEPLNRVGVNCIRSFPVYGNIIWGARTLNGADDLAHEYKYVAVRRTALFIQQSLQRGLKWTVFEGNDDTLWSQIRLNVGAFMQNLHRDGAFQGAAAKDAYLVKCDEATTRQADIDLGFVNILVGFAPLKPAEFVVLKFQQLTKLNA